MADGLGFVNPVEALFLERVVREEGHGRDLPRKRRDEKARPQRAVEPETAELPDPAGEGDRAMPLTHIDLRI